MHTTPANQSEATHFEAALESADFTPKRSYADNSRNQRPGDMFGFGTSSDPRTKQGGLLLELSNGGKHAIQLLNSEARTLLEDGDTVIFRGYCQRDGFKRIGFNERRGTVLPAHD